MGLNKKQWAEFGELYPGVVRTDEKVTDPQIGDWLCDGWGVGQVVQTYRSDKAVVSWKYFLDDCETIQSARDKLTSMLGLRRATSCQPEGVLAAIRATVKWRNLVRIKAATRYTADARGQGLANLAPWKKLGLCPQVGQLGTLVWKVVDRILEADRTYTGVMRAQYVVGKHYSYPYAMATAGPIGAVKGYGHTNEVYVLALVAKEVYKSYQDGAFYVPEGLVSAAYRVDAIVRRFGGDVEIETTMVEGIDLMHLIEHQTSAKDEDEVDEDE